MADRPSMIGHIREHETLVGGGEPKALWAPIGRALGLERLGVNHETIPPGGRSSVPHAHSKEEEFVFVIAGTPSLWIDGELHELKPGDAAAFPAGTGIAHSVLNNSNEAIRLLIVGEARGDDEVIYPINPEKPHPRIWKSAPLRPIGPHNGMAD
jgi:uncharacterized cupin superfamily protein